MSRILITSALPHINGVKHIGNLVGSLLPADFRFLPDRYVEGVCPQCGFAAARGDQCDGCGALLDPIDLVAPRSALSGSTALEPRQSRHLFLRQSLLVDRLNRWITWIGRA